MSGTIETIELPELVAIGIPVDALWNDLPVEVPKAWRRLFELDTGATAFLEISLAREFDMYHEFVGYLAAKATDVPDGLVRIVIPPRRYLRLIHDGPLEEIAAGFEKLYHSAAVQGLAATDFKLDFGYQPGLPPGRHELHVAITNPKALLG
jgi:predicted transcriptional regulator YdeE